jgi:hypothetical protein
MSVAPQIYATGVRGGAYHEDVIDEIFEITPDDTPFYNMIGDSVARSVWEDWERDSLDVRSAANAAAEGKVYTNASSFLHTALPSRVTNWCQIFDKLPRVTLTQQAMDPVGITDLMAHQVSKREREFKTDIEHALLRGSLNSGPTTGTDAAVRRLGGFHNVMTYTTLQASIVTFNESIFNDWLENGWIRGASLRDVLAHGRIKRGISAFTASSTKYIFSEDRRIVNAVDVYESDFYLTQIHKSRDVLTDETTLPRRCLYLFDRDFFTKAWLRKPSRRRLADRGDSVEMAIVAELTLKYGHPAAGTVITGLNAIPTS